MGLFTISNLLFRKGDIVFVENPTYHLALNIFKDAELQIVPGKYMLKILKTSGKS